MEDFGALSTQIAEYGYPTGTQSDAYTPTNSPQACPTIQADWVASDSLPPTPNATVCDCMYSSLSCIPAADVASNTTAVGSLFAQVCGDDLSACTGITGNVTSGVYGPFVMCNSTQQLGYVLNQYYLNQNSRSSACNFDGQAQLLSGAATPASSCSDVLASASSSTATSTSTERSEGSNFGPHSSINLGNVAVGLYTVMATCVGFTMILL